METEIRYFRCTYPFEDVEYYEMLGDGALRQLTIMNGKPVSSNIDLHLASSSFEISENEEYVDRITKQDFDEVWNAHLENYRTQWEQAKALYPIDTEVTGSLKIFFPQGAIVQLKNALGVADYWQCRESTQPENMYPTHKITAIVEGYDEVNQWIKLGSPQVYPDYLEISD
jgi:hypothetical protein